MTHHANALLPEQSPERHRAQVASPRRTYFPTSRSCVRGFEYRHSGLVRRYSGCRPNCRPYRRRDRLHRSRRDVRWQQLALDRGLEEGQSESRQSGGRRLALHRFRLQRHRAHHLRLDHRPPARGSSSASALTFLGGVLSQRISSRTSSAVMRRVSVASRSNDCCLVASRVD